jgi:hypothetical protein
VKPDDQDHDGPGRCVLCGQPTSRNFCHAHDWAAGNPEALSLNHLHHWWLNNHTPDQIRELASGLD